jgi:hypothetical protein
MFERLKLSSAYSGLKVAVVFTHALTGQAYNGSGYTTWSAANLVAGCVQTTFDADGFASFGTPPPVVAAGPYIAAAYLVAASNLATSDLANRPVGQSKSIVAVDSTGKAIVTTAGPGPDPCTITINDGSPVSGAQVWVSADAAGTNVIAGTLLTNGSGQATFMLTAGSTYYLWMLKAGQVPIIGQSFVAVAD